MLSEYHQTKGESRVDISLLNSLAVNNNFQSYVTHLTDESKGEHLPRGYVTATTYWLVANEKVLGRVNIRHRLTELLLREGGHIGYDIRPSKRNQGYGKKILALALSKAKVLGITKALVTCDETNLASKRVIEANGGVLENSVSMGSSKPRKLRYWITLS